MSVNTPRFDDPQFAAMQRYNEDSGGYLMPLLDAAYGPRGRNLWDRANIERLIDDAEDYMAEHCPDPWTRWSYYVRDTIIVLRRLLANDPATVAQHGLIDDLVVDSEEEDGDMTTHMAQTSSYPTLANPYSIATDSWIDKWVKWKDAAASYVKGGKVAQNWR